jgi:hypothetical protein
MNIFRKVYKDKKNVQMMHHLMEMASTSSSQTRAEASLGMRQSPLGERLTEPTLGPSGKQLRLNCCEKKRR